MKTPIEVSDIRKGDLIRWEEGGGSEYAKEWRSTGAEYCPPSGQHYLLDRPKPAVELPTEPTLGWLHVTDTGEGVRTAGQVLSVFRGRDGRVDGGVAGSWSRDYITAFTPATAVPAAALDELREFMRHFSDGALLTRSGNQIRDFLAAVDEANS